MKKIGDKYTNNTFESIKHIDDYGNDHIVCQNCSDSYFTIYCDFCADAINTSVDVYYTDYTYYVCESCYSRYF